MATAFELTIRQFNMWYTNTIKQPKEIGSQLRRSIAVFHKKNARRTKPGKLSADYIVGLTDGEGSFTVYLLPPKKEHGSINYRVLCRYYIKMWEDLLPKEYRPNQRNNYRFEIFDYVLLKQVVVPFFKRHPLESKRIKDFHLFCEILDLAIAKAHHTKDGLERIAALKAQMHA